MAPTNVTKGSSGFIGIGLESDGGVAVAPTVYLPFDSETFATTIDRAESEGITGSRSRPKLESVQTLKKPGGGFVCSGVNAQALPILIEAVMGGSVAGGSTGACALAEALSYYTVVVYKGVKKFTYAGCKVGKLTLSSSKGAQLLKADISGIVAMSEAIAANDLSASYTRTQRPLTHRDSVLKIDTAAIPVEEISIEIENVLDADQFFNSQERLAVPETDRKVGGSVTPPWNADAYTAALTKFYSGETAAIEATWTDGTHGLVVSLPQVYFTGTTPQIGGRGVMNLPAPFEAKDSVAAANDSVGIVLS